MRLGTEPGTEERLTLILAWQPLTPSILITCRGPAGQARGEQGPSALAFMAFSPQVTPGWGQG